jgi:son of sevenless-like protein
MGYDYNPEDVVFNMEGKVKGGKLETLVERLTLHDNLDTIYMQAFLLTYRSFTNSFELFRLLERRYLIQPPGGLNPEELQDWIKNKRHPVQLRLVIVLDSQYFELC